VNIKGELFWGDISGRGEQKEMVMGVRLNYFKCMYENRIRKPTEIIF
jgi:hypothetical protein